MIKKIVYKLNYTSRGIYVEEIWFTKDISVKQIKSRLVDVNWTSTDSKCRNVLKAPRRPGVQGTLRMFVDDNLISIEN